MADRRNMESSRGIPDEEMFLSKPAPDDCADSPTVGPLRIFKPQSSANASRPSPSIAKTSFPLPPGASSSAAPLPFPDDDDVRKPTPPKPFGSAYTAASPRLDTSQSDKQPSLAERRGASPKVIHSPTSPDADQGLFARPLKEQTRPGPSNASYPHYQKPYNYPQPSLGSTSSNAADGDSNRRQHAEHAKSDDPGVNRFASTASNSTTRATRGSPPPPETPVVEPGTLPGGGIEARYAASGISGTATLNSLQAHHEDSVPVR
ncbi:hypothetical protein HIM_00429 [Hirsutella minnesotensis 3608]|nr:hypothetical protein HIM_00429 [Hirsutella minnesotensis 3608]